MKRLAIYAHFDAERKVRRFTNHYLEALSEHVGRIDFVSTAELPQRELGKLDSCTTRANRPNRGFDFGMWKWALEQHDLNDWDELVLTNSSVFGPLVPLSGMFDKMAESDCDFWGATDNYEFDWHIQSYFVVFRRPILRSDIFRRFWESVLPYRNKFQVIRSYEVGLSQLLVESGFKGEAHITLPSLFPDWPVDAFIRYKRRNPTCYHPTRLLRRGTPFVKAQLLRDNPIGVQLDAVYRELDRCGFDRTLIDFDRPATPRRNVLQRFDDLIHSR